MSNKTPYNIRKMKEAFIEDLEELLGRINEKAREARGAKGVRNTKNL